VETADYIDKIWRVFRETAVQRRSQGGFAAIKFLLRHIYSRYTTVLFESGDKSPPGKPHSKLEAIPLSALEPSAYRRIIEEAGVGSDLIHCERGGVGWVIVSQNEAVAIGWAFKSSPWLSRFGYEPGSAVYLGGYYVRCSHRGQGLYGHLLQRMFAETPAVRYAVAETSVDNISSQRGLQRAGFRRRGLVQRLTFCGISLRFRLEETADSIAAAQPCTVPSRLT
jgi:hypothetical protein